MNLVFLFLGFTFGLLVKQKTLAGYIEQHERDAEYIMMLEARVSTWRIVHKLDAKHIEHLEHGHRQACRLTLTREN